ncbi:hypothetical protein ACGFXC_36005 [Streptomyces sp. NPDC048507]|uniref:hypothetical protein n=1 Tax=Streptomyces sp. NPDC048507 TaxID=3365560 RepID=UPI00371F1FC0
MLERERLTVRTQAAFLPPPDAPDGPLRPAGPLGDAGRAHPAHGTHALRYLAAGDYWFDGGHGDRHDAVPGRPRT